MTEPVPPDIAVQQRRLMMMIAVVSVCVLVAAGAIVGDLALHIAWLVWLFVAAVLVGFGAQVWLILGLRPRR